MATAIAAVKRHIVLMLQILGRFEARPAADGGGLAFRGSSAGRKFQRPTTCRLDTFHPEEDDYGRRMFMRMFFLWLRFIYLYIYAYVYIHTYIHVSLVAYAGV